VLFVAVYTSAYGSFADLMPKSANDPKQTLHFLLTLHYS